MKCTNDCVVRDDDADSPPPDDDDTCGRVVVVATVAVDAVAEIGIVNVGVKLGATLMLEFEITGFDWFKAACNKSSTFCQFRGGGVVADGFVASLWLLLLLLLLLPRSIGVAGIIDVVCI